MLCPEVAKFPPPKTVSTTKHNDNFGEVIKTIQRNSFYKSLIITCPDEDKTPPVIEELIQTDTEYYKLSDCPLAEFIEPTFIEKFIKTGKLYCLSANRNCIVENCAAINTEGFLTINIREPVFQTLGLEGTKRPHNYYEIKINLKEIKQYDKVKQALNKLELFDFFVMWECEELICPSSIAKYFYNRNICTTTEYLTIKHLLPNVTEVPSIDDVDVEEMVEWVGMLAHMADLTQSETYISTYCEPDSELSLKTTRISVLIVKGFILPSLLIEICSKLSELTRSRSVDNYWTAISIQSQEDSLWQWTPGAPKMFQAHDSSYNVFFGRNQVATHLIGQIKYS